MTDLGDEVSFSEYQRACRVVAHCGSALEQCGPDEAVEHWLPLLTRELALIYNFVGANMTGRQVPRYMRNVAELEIAKSGTLPGDTQQTGGNDGGITDAERGGAAGGSGAPEQGGAGPERPV